MHGNIEVIAIREVLDLLRPTTLAAVVADLLEYAQEATPAQQQLAEDCRYALACVVGSEDAERMILEAAA